MYRWNKMLRPPKEPAHGFSNELQHPGSTLFLSMSAQRGLSCSLPTPMVSHPTWTLCRTVRYGLCPASARRTQRRSCWREWELKRTSRAPPNSVISLTVSYSLTLESSFLEVNMTALLIAYLANYACISKDNVLHELHSQ